MWPIILPKLSIKPWLKRKCIAPLILVEREPLKPLLRLSSTIYSKALRPVLNTLIKTLKMRAQEKLRILRPSTNLSMSRIRAAFMMKMNRPKLRMMTGKLRISRIGLIKRFTSDIPSATPKAVVKLRISTPSNNLADTNTATLSTKNSNIRSPFDFPFCTKD